jgi:hypothetical protein
MPLNDKFVDVAGDTILRGKIKGMVFNTTFNNISAILTHDDGIKCRKRLFSIQFLGTYYSKYVLIPVKRNEIRRSKT